MSLLTERGDRFPRYRSYKYFAPTEQVVGSAESGGLAASRFSKSASLGHKSARPRVPIARNAIDHSGYNH